jgi:hypothetical protein
MAQLAAHTIGLVPAAATIAIGQRLALERHTQLERWFIPVTIVSMSVAFLVGAYVLRPPFDFLLGYAAVGAVLELASRTIDRQHIREAVIQAAATSGLFTGGAFIGMLALSLVARASGLRLGEPGEAVVRHLVTMVLGGLFIGAAIGAVTARRITKRQRPVGPRH